MFSISLAAKVYLSALISFSLLNYWACLLDLKPIGFKKNRNLDLFKAYRIKEMYFLPRSGLV